MATLSQQQFSLLWFALLCYNAILIVGMLYYRAHSAVPTAPEVIHSGHISLELNTKRNLPFTQQNRTTKSSNSPVKPIKQSNSHSQNHPTSQDYAVIRQIWRMNSNRSSPGAFRAVNSLKNCSLSQNRQHIFDMLKAWSGLAARHDIIYVLTYGTLIGQVRHEDVIPYDLDNDLYLLKSDEHKILSQQTPREQIPTNRYSLIARRDKNETGRRFDCAGRRVTRQSDICAFQSPVMRMITRQRERGVFLDFFLLYKQVMQAAPDARNSEYFVVNDYQYAYPSRSIFPLRICNFLGLKMPCPNRPHQVLRETYKTNFLKPSKVCIGKAWVNVD